MPVIGRGHSPEHACLWARDLGVLICGDILLPRISPNIGVWPTEPRQNPLAHYLASLDNFASIDAGTLVLPAHGLPYRGVRTRIAELKAHHAERLDRPSSPLRPSAALPPSQRPLRGSGATCTQPLPRD